MQKYQYLLFDVDQTLLDFKACERSALQESFAYFNLNQRHDIYDYYQQYNKQLWQDFENGKIQRETIFEIRFNNVFKHFKIDLDGKVFEAYYRSRLSANHQLMPYALEVLQHLSEKYDIYLVSNGLIQTQRQRIKESQIQQYVKGIFISEEIGFKKPSKEYFDYVFCHIPCFQKDKALMIGDSLNADMLGGRQVGLDVCFMNEANIKQNIVKVDYEINDLRQLIAILEGNHE